MVFHTGVNASKGQVLLLNLHCSSQLQLKSLSSMSFVLLLLIAIRSKTRVEYHPLTRTIQLTLFNLFSLH